MNGEAPAGAQDPGWGLSHFAFAPESAPRNGPVRVYP
jgi:hypothetical protein